MYENLNIIIHIAIMIVSFLIAYIIMKDIVLSKGPELRDRIVNVLDALKRYTNYSLDNTDTIIVHSESDKDKIITLEYDYYADKLYLQYVMKTTDEQLSGVYVSVIDIKINDDDKTAVFNTSSDFLLKMNRITCKMYAHNIKDLRIFNLDNILEGAKFNKDDRLYNNIRKEVYLKLDDILPLAIPIITKSKYNVIGSEK